MAKLFQCCFFNVEEHTLTQLSFSTKYQRWNNTGSSTLNQCNSFRLLLTLFCQRYNNVDKCMSAQLSFSTKYQRWNNVDECWRSTLFQRWFNVDVFAGFSWRSSKHQHLMVLWPKQLSKLSTYLALISILNVWNMAFIVALLIRVDLLEEKLQLSLNN